MAGGRARSGAWAGKELWVIAAKRARKHLVLRIVCSFFEGTWRTYAPRIG
jgi:hypothetical protein